MYYISLLYVIIVCNTVCLLPLLVIDKAMMKKSFDGAESRVYDLLEDVCARKNFLTYDYVPPKMVAQCKKLIGLFYNI